MAKIFTTYKIPDGDYCTTNNLVHCQFRTSMFKVDGINHVECIMFNRTLELVDNNWFPVKCEECKKREKEYRRVFGE